MKTLRILRAIAPADLANISREYLLAFLITLPVTVALLYRFMIPGLSETLQTRLDFDLAPYHPLLMGIFIGMAPSLVGAVYGLLLVDERDERTLAALRVMPVPFGTYLSARLLLPTILSVIFTIAAYPLANMTPLPWTTVTALALSAATFVPVAALTVVGFAPNKVTGLVLFRLVNTAAALPALAFLAIGAWERAAWIVPSFWPMKALWLAAEGQPYGLELTIAPIMNIVLMLILYRHLTRRNE